MSSRNQLKQSWKPKYSSCNRSGLRGRRAGTAGGKQTADRGRKFCKSGAVRLVTGALPFGRHAHQAGIDQNLEMLRDGRLRQVQPLNDILAAAGIGSCKMLENVDASRMRKRGKFGRNRNAVT